MVFSHHNLAEGLKDSNMMLAVTNYIYFINSGKRNAMDGVVERFKNLTSDNSGGMGPSLDSGQRG